MLYSVLYKWSAILLILFIVYLISVFSFKLQNGSHSKRQACESSEMTILMTAVCSVGDSLKYEGWLYEK
jgi:hypothetical protein